MPFIFSFPFFFFPPNNSLCMLTRQKLRNALPHCINTIHLTYSRVGTTMSFHQQTEAFELWLKTEKVQISPKIQLKDLRSAGQGRAVVAIQDIDEDDIMFELPRLVLLNAGNNSLVEDHPELREKLLDLGQWEALVLVVMYEWKVKKNSRWLPYLEVLPLTDSKNYKFDQLIFWEENELAKLHPSLIVDRVGKLSTLSMYNKLFPTIAVDEFKLSELADTTLHEFNTVATSIMSYSFDVENAKDAEDLDDEDIEQDDEASIRESDYLKSMVPLGDTLNADTHKHNASLMYTASSLVMRAVKPIKQGEQVYNTYSDHPNAEILRRYGYVEQYGSAHDFAEVSLEVIKKYFRESTSLSLETVEDILAVLKEIEAEEEENFVLDTFDIYASGDISFEFTFLVQLFTVVAGINDQRSFNFASLDVKARGLRRVFKKCYQFLESGKLTLTYVDIYKKILMLRMAEYPKIAHTDFAPAKPPLSREELAQTVLRSEYKSLQKCLDFDLVYTGKEVSYAVVEDDKLLRNIMKKDIFEGGENTFKKQRR